MLLLRLLHHAFLLTPLAHPPESIKSGHYGRPARATWWLKQCVIYFLGLFGMKLCVFAVFQLLPWIAWAGDWALRWTDGNEALQITFVMLVFPLVMNALQYYIIDGFIKDPAGGGGGGEHEPLPAEDEEDGGGRASVESGFGDGESVEGADEGAKGAGAIATREAVKEANPTPVPARAESREYDPEVDGASGSSGSSGSSAGGGADKRRVEFGA